MMIFNDFVTFADDTTQKSFSFIGPFKNLSFFSSQTELRWIILSAGGKWYCGDGKLWNAWNFEWLEITEPDGIYYEFHPHFSDIAAPGKNGRLLISSLASFITFTKLFEKEMKLITTSYLTFDDSIQEPLHNFKKVEIFFRRVFQKCYPFWQDRLLLPNG